MVYFDSAATSVPFDCAIDAAKDILNIYGNPSSVHTAGINAKKALESARKDVAAALYVKPTEIIFTGCGSESNNQAIFGLAKLRARRSKRIITTDSEHPSVSAPIAALEAEGWEIVKIPTRGGELDLAALESALALGAAFVAVMQVNNETGAKYDIAAVRKAIDKSGCGALLHCDAVQGFLKTQDLKEIAKNCDTASISAHKIGGFKGVGALYIKSGIKLPAFIKGGGQESGFRSGTENLLGIAAFASACKAYNGDIRNHISNLYDYLCEKLSAIPEVALNIPKNHCDNILLISALGVRSEVMLNALSAEGVCVSAGSACSARKGVTHAMAAYGLDKPHLESALRISIGAHNTTEDCDILAEKLAQAIKRLKR